MCKSLEQNRKLRKFTFLQLPAELRLLIYPLVLCPCRRIKYPDGEVVIEGSTRITTTTVYGGGHGKHVDPWELKTDRTPSKNRYDCDLWPEILATCRTIYREARSFFSPARETWFEFFLWPASDHIPRGSDIQRHCPDLFKYERCDWQAERVPLLLMESVFAAFLRMIGQSNAANITNLKFDYEDADAVGEQMPLITELVRLHMPGLRKVEIHVEEKKVFWEESPDYWHRDRSSPFWMNGEFGPMYRALKDFVTKITWVRRFDYDGQCHFGEYDDGPVRGWDMLKNLGKTAKSRSDGFGTESLGNSIRYVTLRAATFAVIL